MSSITDLVDRVERLLVRHEELKRTNTLLEQQVQALTLERDSLRSRLAAARGRIDALLDRLPVEAADLLEGSDGSEATDSRKTGA
ncbi:TIGR02449 family protein [Mitsuaria sp. PDC51]|jgi:cell division protein ZapB|uniref:cell division protein ZapB n=1 Tax=unclassified Roseateles TaxID=2626991 RepID=UPI0008E252C7|nr:cell division protein ZapB [Mitsuaria sp. PDC51]SFR78310.1 TIGR02449 family protein [Mitsuaria sp. PDC51]